MSYKKVVFIFMGILFGLGCFSSCSCQPEISAERMKKVVGILGSDEFMGRKPFTEGEELSTRFLADALREIGFEPAFDGSYFQPVPMLESTSFVIGDCTVSMGKEQLQFSVPDKMALHAPFPSERVELKNSPLVFCGFGIQAPEYGWDDFKDVDVKGKTIVVLVNDPGLYTNNNHLFRGREMTYYGRWTYKFEKAAELGAEGVIIIHEPVGAGYGYNVPENNAISSHLYLDDEQSADRCKVAGWMSAETAVAIFSRLGYDVAQLREAACSPQFKAFPLNASLSVQFDNKLVKQTSKNVAGILKGTKSPDEALLFAAHWDHFGIGKPSRGDSIFNGAVDNAVPIAWSLEICRALANMKPKPERSVILLFPTAEEQGLLGSLYYTEHPVVPMAKTVAVLSNDIMIPRGRMNDLTIIGYGYSTLDSLFALFAAEQGRYILPDPNPESGLFFRGDQYSFYRAGVASSWALGCYDSREHGKEWAERTYKDFVANSYHTPHDNYDPDWDWSGVVEDATLTLRLARWLTNSSHPYPRLSISNTAKE